MHHGGGAGDAVGGPITAVSFNIRVGAGAGDRGTSPYLLRKRKKDLRPVIDTLKSLNPDVAGLQEVQGAGQAEEIAGALGMAYAYAPHPSKWWGVAVLSKYPVRDCRTRTISTGWGNGKVALACRVGSAERPLTVVSVHKDRDIMDGTATRRAAAFARRFDNVILTGDFNVAPRGPRYEALRAAFFDTALVGTAGAARARRAGTFGAPSGNTGGRRIDYIFVRPDEFDTLDAGLAADAHRRASDHRAVFARLRYRVGRK